MTAMTRNTLAAAFTVVLLAACPKAPKPDGGTPVDGGNTCADAIDCPDPQLFACNQTTLTCEPSCRVKADCTAASRGPYALDYCDSSARGCECDEGRCVASLCSSDVDCGSQVCRNGQCVAPPTAASVASCKVTPDYVILKPGATAKFWVSASDASGKPVVVKEGATWTALGLNLTVPAGTTGLSAVYTGGPAGAAADSVQAAFGAVNCKAKALILSPPAQGTMGVLVYDELSSRPVEGARVMVSDTATGAVVLQGGVDSVATGANGYVAVTPGAAGRFSITAFHADYSYLTVAGYGYPAANADGNFLALALRRNQSDKYGGYKGTFTNVPATSNVHAGLAGMSLAGSITNLSLGQLLGPSQPTDIVIGSAINQKGVMIPAGAYLGFGDSQIKPNIAGQGLAGVCGTGTPADELKIKNGTCGTRTAWALAGDVAIVDLPIDQLAGGLNNIDVGKLLARIVPIFKKFNSSIVRDVEFDLRTTPIDMATGKYNFSDQTQFVTSNHNFVQMPLAFGFAAKLPDLPKFQGNYADAVALIGGANVPGRGVVPLGIGVGANTNGDAKVDKPDDLPAAGMVKMRMAPTHDGIEGAEYGIVMAALSAKGLTDASAGLALSAIYPRIKDNKLIFDPTGATYADFSASAFPPFPEGAKYNYSDSQQGALAKRTFQFKAALAAGVSVVRVSFGDDLDHRWDVLMEAPTAAGAALGFTLPKPPSSGGAFIDRTFANGMASGGRSSMLVQAFALNSDPAHAGTALTFANLVELNSTNLDRVTDFLSAFSLEDYAPPSISFKTPNADGTSVTRGTKIVVNVKSFKVGATADGVVKFTITLGGNPVLGCTDPNGSVVSAEATAGTGDVEYTIPTATSCTGAGVVAKAQLYLPDGVTALDPPVATTRTMTIPP